MKTQMNENDKKSKSENDKSSKTKRETMASNAQRIRELAAMISVHDNTKKRMEVLAEIQREQDRLSFILSDLEIRGQEEKINSMEKVLSLLNAK